jgi:EAL domain-containing protein (putative c-di-GMP-specific phosphodiesterase class I)
MARQTAVRDRERFMLRALRKLFAPDKHKPDPGDGKVTLAANHVADALCRFNCTLALDDFGAGYSSLARLRQLPFSELKIDRSYVTNCNSDRISAGLCETIVELGQRFGLKTVAEGIETTHESHKLQGIGCNIGQGYLFAKPMPKAQLIGIMRRRLMDRPAA